MKLSKDSLVPLYLQVADYIQNKINDGSYKYGEKIDSESIMNKTLGVSVVTIRAGIASLVEQGILIKKHGKGTYVAMPMYTESLLAEGSFSKSCLLIGKTPSTKILFCEKIQGDLDVCNKLGLKKEEQIIKIIRLRYVDNIPSLYEVDYFRKEFEFLFKAQIDKVPLLDLIYEKTGLVAKMFDDVIDIYLADKNMKQALCCKENAPLLKVAQTVIDREDQIIYYNEQYIKSEHYKFSVRSYK